MPAIWYPGCKCRFQIRFEDFLPLPPLPAPPGTPGAAEAFGSGAAVSTGFVSSNMDIIPYSVSVELNSYRKADEARITLPLASMPFDPRILRAMTVQVFGGTFTPKEWAEANGPVDSKGLILPDFVPLTGGRKEAGESNEIFRGFVDMAEMSLSGHDTITLTARDLTGELIDKEVSPGYLNDLPEAMPLDLLIQLLLTGDGAPTPEISRRFGVPGFRGLLVVNESSQKPLPSIAQIRPPQWLDSLKTTRRGRKNPPTSGSNQSYWDVITDLVVSAGLIVYMRPGVSPIPNATLLPAAEIVISDPRTYYKENTIPGGPVANLNVRAFIYGRNLTELNISRKLGGVKTPTIEVVAHDTDTGETIRGRYPPILLKNNNSPTVSGIGDNEEIKVFELDEISGPGATAQLDVVAQSIHEQLARGEMKVNFTTKAMSGLLINADEGIEADLFRLRPGDPIQILVDSADVETGYVSSYTLFTKAPFLQRVDQMISNGIAPSVAFAAATALDNPFIQTTFRTQKIMCSWSNDSGWEFGIDAINYLDVRNAAPFEAVPSL